MSSVVATKQLTYAFGRGNLRKAVLSDIELTLNTGEIVLLEGPSGSGKTTLLSLVGALRTMQTGSLQVFGQELLGAKSAHLMRTRSQIGFIFQHHNLLNCLTAWER